MSVNENKKSPRAPDFLCNQDNGKCGSTRTYNDKEYFNPTGAWKPRPRTAEQPRETQAPKVDPKVWEMKDRLSQAQTAMNSASAVYQGTSDVKATIEAYRLFYNELRLAKFGTLPSATLPATHSEVGRKIAEAMKGDEPEIDVKDIPF